MKSTSSKTMKPTTTTTSSRVVKTAAKDARTSTKKTLNKVLWEFPFTKNNYIILAIGFVVILIGYALMSTAIGDNQPVEGGNWANPLAVDWAPVFLVIGYCIIIPFGILKFFPKKIDDDAETKI